MLAAALIVSLNTASMKGRDSRRLEDVKQLKNALQLYFDTFSGYPATLGLLAPAYISAVPRDPIGGASYTYDLVGGTVYHLGANLERRDNIGLNSDADIDTATIHGSDDTNCAGSASPPRYCYDVRP